MRLVHLACVAPPEIGGMGQVAYDEVKGLRARGVQATLVTAAGIKGTQAEEEGMIRLPNWVRVGNAALVNGLVQAMEGADIIHLHYPWYGVAERLLWREPAKPVVVTFHMDATAPDWRGPIFRLHQRFIQSRLLRHANKILVSSRDYAEHSSLRPLLSELGDRLIELPFGLDTSFFCPPVTLHDSRFSILDSQPTILFVGALDRAHSFKGLPVLLDAMLRLPKQTVLHIVGDGDLREAFAERVRELGLEERVTFLGRIDRERLRSVYQAAHVLAVPSVSAAEAFGLAALEAQACGTPVVASRLPGVRTVVVDRETGLLVEPDNVSALASALEHILTDSSLRGRLGAQARAHVLGTYAETRHVERLLAIYHAVCPR